jgi:hypothetical protein
VTQHQIRVTDDGRHQVGWTRNGIDFTPVGEPFDKPRPAIDYAKELDGWGPASRSTSAPDLARLGAESRDEGPASSEAPGPQAASTSTPSTCASCGGPLPPGSRRQRRTCSGACRVALARGQGRQDAEEAPEDDVDGGPRSSVTVSGAPGAPADPTPRVDRDARALPRSTQGAGADLSPGGEPGPLLLGF